MEVTRLVAEVTIRIMARVAHKLGARGGIASANAIFYSIV